MKTVREFLSSYRITVQLIKILIAGNNERVHVIVADRVEKRRQRGNGIHER